MTHPPVLDISLKKQFGSPKQTHTMVLSLTIQAGDFVSVFGPSGAGKTSLLRMIAGLIHPDEGHIIVDGVPWFDSKKNVALPPQNRDIGIVFQHHMPLPHMSVRQNAYFSLKDKHDTAFADALLEMVGLADYARHKPHTLSGGEQQRLAMVRALARKPKLLLLDEPFTALDNALKEHIHQEICGLCQRFGITTLFVSHTLADIYRLSHYVFVLEKGEIMRHGKPEMVFASLEQSGKMQFTGHIIRIVSDDIIHIAVIQVGNHIVNAVLSENEARLFAPGNRVLLSAKAFQPMLMKL